jgi:hypothetical protein
MITPTEVINTVIGSAITIGCIYCIWNGHKVMRKWIVNSQNTTQVVRINRTVQENWATDDDNPANWYLKNPNKLKVMK